MRLYKKIFEIKFKHGYYDNFVMPSGELEIIPIGETEKHLKNYHMIFKKNSDSASIIYEFDKEGENEEPFIRFVEQLKFSFKIKQINSKLISISQLPFIKMNKEIFYFTNKTKNKTIQNGKISIEQFVSDKDKCVFLPKAIDKILEYSENELKIYNDNNELIINNKKQLTNLELSKKLLQLNDGKYILDCNKTKFNFVIYKQERKSIIGYIDIYLNHSSIDKIQKNKEDYHKYEIEFKQRETFWQYVVVNKFSKVKKLKIIDEHNNVVFKQEKNQDDRKLIFISNKRLPLRKNQKYIFQLVNIDGSSSYDVLYLKLPYASAKNISKVESMPSEIISKMYVYI